uniref:Tetratricopeptide repeat-containing protein n=1 Tax=Candidatus Kentrum sp. SD TaxID=2126332 RepID=A0A451BRK0_9GAMM|nr:MAG: Tetratricopeptide repeat-containing protein [Candidatus Kentron sp. SD]
MDLFHRVGFHPLSIAVLTQQLKTRLAPELGERLRKILRQGAVSTIADQGADQGASPGLIASLELSLELSLECFSEAERHAARRLGVFRGGAMEDVLGHYGPRHHGIRRKRRARESPGAAGGAGGRRPARPAPRHGEGDPRRRRALGGTVGRASKARTGKTDRATSGAVGLPAPAAEDRWPNLRRQLEAAALLRIERIPGVGVPFLRFHPTLAPLLWAGLEDGERDALTLAHRRRYHALANTLYYEDAKNPQEVRAIVRRELPNLLHACHGALDAGDPVAVKFVNSVHRFLGHFGMTREVALLTDRATEAAQVFADILAALGDQPSYNRVLTLGQLGRCFRAAGRPDRAEAIYREGIAVTELLEQADQVKRQRAVLRTNLVDVLMLQGQYAEARAEYELGLSTARELNDWRQQGVTLVQLGTLALMEGDIEDAARRYREALELFQRLGEPETEATIQHQLGMAFQEARQWALAERHYREAARLHEKRGALAAAAQTWNQLAMVNHADGRPETAETWFRRAIDGMQNPPSGDRGAKCLNKLADLLLTQPGRLDEARRLAEEALAIDETLDPGAAGIWKTYELLAQIADRQSQSDRAADYRRLARDAKRGFRWFPSSSLGTQWVRGRQKPPPPRCRNGVNSPYLPAYVFLVPGDSRVIAPPGEQLSRPILTDNSWYACYRLVSLR